jgi:hypothetical protein
LSILSPMGEGARRVRPVSTPRVAERRGLVEKGVLAGLVLTVVLGGGLGGDVGLEEA